MIGNEKEENKGREKEDGILGKIQSMMLERGREEEMRIAER